MRVRFEALSFERGKAARAGRSRAVRGVELDLDRRRRLLAERHLARDQPASRGTAASSRRRHAAVVARLGAVVDQVHEAGVLERRLGHRRAVWRGPACSTSSRQNEVLLRFGLYEHGVAPVVAAALDHDRVGRHARRRHLWPPSPDCRRDTITLAALEQTPASSASSVHTSRERAASSSSLSSATPPWQPTAQQRPSQAHRRNEQLDRDGGVDELGHALAARRSRPSRKGADVFVEPRPTARARPSGSRRRHRSHAWPS